MFIFQAGTVRPILISMKMLLIVQIVMAPIWSNLFQTKQPKCSDLQFLSCVVPVIAKMVVRRKVRILKSKMRLQITQRAFTEEAWRKRDYYQWQYVLTVILLMLN